MTHAQGCVPEGRPVTRPRSCVGASWSCKRATAEPRLRHDGHRGHRLASPSFEENFLPPLRERAGANERRGHPDHRQLASAGARPADRRPMTGGKSWFIWLAVLNFARGAGATRAPTALLDRRRVQALPGLSSGSRKRGRPTGGGDLDHRLAHASQPRSKRAGGSHGSDLPRAAISPAR